MEPGSDIDYILRRIMGIIVHFENRGPSIQNQVMHEGFYYHQEAIEEIVNEISDFTDALIRFSQGIRTMKGGNAITLQDVQQAMRMMRTGSYRTLFRPT